ncbi:proline-rich protein 36, partial [Aplysia californica]|uniref:Proline-rich protein 36 n=1 Tax=Aplysia californica TaxID=6500 RepID=A0ABM1A698_APLCA
MTEINPPEDSKLKSFSLSVDAAEFVPLGGTTGPAPSAGSPAPSSCGPLVVPPLPPAAWTEGRGLNIAEVPRFLTSCYPFVAPEACVGPGVPRLSHPRFPFPVVPGSFPVPAPPPVRFPAWQTTRPPGVLPGYHHPPATLVPPPPPAFDPVTSVVTPRAPQDVGKMRDPGGLGLLGSSPAACPQGQGLLLTSQGHPPAAPLTGPAVAATPHWMVSSPPRPLFVPGPRAKTTALLPHRPPLPSLPPPPPPPAPPSSQSVSPQITSSASAGGAGRGGGASPYPPQAPTSLHHDKGHGDNNRSSSN